MSANKKERYLFCLDIDKIQDYVLATTKLKSIVGASALIDKINFKDSVNELKSSKSSYNSYNIIYSKGGNTKIVFDDRKDAKKYETKLINMYKEKSIDVTTCIKKFDSDKDSQNKVLKDAEKEIQKKKYNKDFTTTLVTSPYLKNCELCGKEYAEIKYSFPGDKVKYICRVCNNKLTKNAKSFRGLEGYTFKENFEEMFSDDMLAVVVMDGNKMGKKIETLIDNNKDNAFIKLKEFSDRTESITHESLLSGLEKISSDKDVNYFRPIIVAGDDICFVIQASFAVSFTEKVINSIIKKSKNQTDLFGNDGIQMCAGIVFMKYNFPFNVGYTIAESLLKNAKRKSVENNNEAVIDFHQLYSASADNITMIRDNEYYYDLFGKEYLLTKKPYKINELDDFIKKLENYKKLISTNKLKEFRVLLREGKERINLELMKMASKISEESRRKEFLKNFLDNDIWIEDHGLIKTDMLDIIEMIDIMEV